MAFRVRDGHHELFRQRQGARLTRKSLVRTPDLPAISPCAAQKSMAQRQLKPCFSWSQLFLFKTRRIEVAKSVALLLHCWQERAQTDGKT